MTELLIIGGVLGVGMLLVIHGTIQDAMGY